MGRQIHRTPWILDAVNQVMGIHKLYSIEELYLVTPGYMNQQKSWRMDRIKKIISAQEPNEEAARAFIYEFIDNSRLVNSSYGSGENVLVNSKIILDLTTPRS